MDIISHGLWGGIAFGRKSKRQYLSAFLFGIMPDFLSFGIYTFLSVIGVTEWRVGPRNEDLIPAYVHTLYNLTHSLVIFAAVFGLVWLLRKKPFIPMLGWALHIFIDIPTHSTEFFATPWLWPISGFRVDGISWAHPSIFLTNVALLIIAYSFWWWRSRKSRKPEKSF